MPNHATTFGLTQKLIKKYAKTELERRDMMEEIRVLILTAELVATSEIKKYDTPADYQVVLKDALTRAQKG